MSVFDDKRDELEKHEFMMGIPRGRLAVTMDMVERIRQEVRKVGFWKNSAMREQLTRSLVRDLDRAGVCPAGKERDLAQRLVALAKENYENLTRP